MREVAIVGANMIKFGRYPDKFVDELAAEAAVGALKDAGISAKEVQVLVSGNLRQPMTGQRITRHIGMTGVPIVNVVNNCATGSTAFRDAYLMVATGLYDVALVVGSEQLGKMGLLGGGGGDPYDRVYPTEGYAGSETMPTVFAQAGVEHMRKYGTTIEQFAKIAVKNHKHGTLNPYAQYQIETPLEMVLNARMISWPNTLYMCCPTGDGAAAAIIMPLERARRHTAMPIKVAASVLTSDPWSERDLAVDDVNTLTRKAAQEAYGQAGLGPKDLDMVELHDCFATPELLHYENLGLCADGEGGRMIDEGRTYNGGDIPVNVSGGLLSKGHPLGATGVANIVEVTWHLRGQAGPRQVQGAKVGLAHVIGVGAACTIHILTK
ncbi:MAG: thiolase family protein [Chloroflexi bacterium]|nr:thiolase family protein [Chloroflexota bacterium]